MVLLHFSCVTSSLWRCLLCCLVCRLSRVVYFFFFFKQKTAYEMRISDWSSDVCSSDLFQDGRTLSTVLFWLSCVMCLFMVYALSSWLTKLMASAGYSIGSALTFVIVMNLGGIFGAIAGGWLADRLHIKYVQIGRANV